MPDRFLPSDGLPASGKDALSAEATRSPEHVALRWATARPDEDLLRRYFARQAGLGPFLVTSLSAEEHRQVVASLNVNSSWQVAWRRLEAEFTLDVEWEPLPPLPESLRSRRGEAHRAPYRLRKFARGTLVVGLGLVVVYAGLWGWGQATRPDTHALASLDAARPWLSSASRDTEPRVANPDPYDVGVRALLDAEVSDMGLFPRYDLERVAEGEQVLETTLSDITDPFRRGTVLYLLTKAALMKDQPSEASRWLDSLDALGIDWRSEFYADEVQRLRSALP